MKKLMIALAAVAVGIAANAASYTWSVSSGRIYDGAETPAYVAANTVAYLMFTSTLTQDELVTKFNEGTAADYVSANKVGTGTINSNARILDGTASAAVTSEQTAYFVVFANDKMYVSTTATAAYDALDASPVAFAGQTTPSKSTFTSGTYTANGAGWYGAAAVPEPTSGLLMLLGMAGLALLRRRA